MLTDPPTKILIVSPPGMMCDSLCNVLSGLPNIRIVAVFPLTDQLTQEIMHHRPDVVLIDCSGEVQDFELIRDLKNRLPYQSCIAITENANKARQAFLYGVDDVLLRGCTGYEFRVAIQKIIEQNRLSGRAAEGLGSGI